MDCETAPPRTAALPVVSVVGRSKVGKTTFLAKLIAELCARGYRVGAIKHSVHSFHLSERGKDTQIHAAAGARVVVFASARELVLSRTLEQELALDQIVAQIALVDDLDIILTEGFKSAHMPKIEVSRRERGTTLVSPADELIAVVCDHPVEVDVPTFDLDDATGVATLLYERFLSPAAKDKSHP
jgi:molybdopterin-guanine dinucleotide biosynthesis protein B